MTLQLHTGKRIRPRRCLIYGIEGIGKSTFGAMAPQSVFIQTEDGLDDIECASFEKATSFSEVTENMGKLYESDHDRKTLVVDSLDWLERLIWANVCKRTNVDSIEKVEKGFGKGYIFALDEWNEFLAGCTALRDDRGMNIVLVAHASIKRFEDPNTESYDRYLPRLQERASNLVREWCDEVLFATYKTFTRSTEEGFNKTRTLGIGTGERVLRTTHRPSHIAKNRLNMPDEIPLDWNAYASCFSKT